MRIRIVRKNDYWLVDRTKRKTTASAFLLLEKKLGQRKGSPTARLKEKTSVYVIYDQRDITNETEKSHDPKYLLQLTAQFLEDYATKEWLKEKQKQYEN